MHYRSNTIYSLHQFHVFVYKNYEVLIISLDNIINDNIKLSQTLF